MPETKTEGLRERIAELLMRADYPGLTGLGATDTAVLRALIGMSYDKASLLSWRAMDAIGMLTEAMPSDKVRTLIQRVLWMMREESGSNAWTGPEILGEIVARKPAPFEDIAAIIVSFHDELIMHAGVLRAMGRIAETRPDLMAEFAEVPLQYLDHKDPSVRGYACLALLRIDPVKYAPALAPLAEDQASFPYYDGKDLTQKRISSIVKDK